MVYKTVTNALSRILGTPQYIILFVSDACWMKCGHCWYNEDWKSENLRHPELSFDELERLAKSIERIHFLSLTGGEAFRREDIVEVVRLFARRTKLGRYQIPTSGFMPDLIVERAERMLRDNPRTPFRVDVSIDGTESTHERIRNIHGGFARALETLRGLRKLKERCAWFDVGVISTISKQNQHEVEEIGALVESVHPDGEWMVNITRGKPRDPTAVDVDVRNYWRAHEIIEERIRAGRYRGHSGHFLASWLSAKNATRRRVIRDIVEGRTRGGGCAAGALAGVIFNDGEVMPCELLDRGLGNLRDFDFDLRRLWNSEEARRVRAWIQDTRCQCTQECFLSVSLLIQPRHWPDIVRQRLLLGTASRHGDARAASSGRPSATTGEVAEVANE